MNTSFDECLVAYRKRLKKYVTWYKETWRRMATDKVFDDAHWWPHRENDMNMLEKIILDGIADTLGLTPNERSREIFEAGLDGEWESEKRRMREK